MPFVQTETPRIAIQIPDWVSGNTTVKRKAELFTLLYNQETKQLILSWTVKHYADESGQYGEYLGKTIPDWSKETIADNTTMCNAANGYPLEQLEAEDPEADENGYPSGTTYMGQYDFFYALAATQPVEIHPMVIQFGGLVQSWEKK